jgi:hypothetical protein
MMAEKDWCCWEITGCAAREHCRAARPEEGGRPCWELAGEVDDYRSALNVCKDCIVYVCKHRNSAMSEEEIRRIVFNKVSCVLAVGCPARDGKPEAGGQATARI